MDRPLIGITGSRRRGDQIVDNLGVLAESPIDVFYAHYSQGVIEAGGLPLNVPLDVAARDLVGRLDGLLMTGGTDIDPSRYRAEPNAEVQVINAERDAFELALLDVAIERELPTLGICRGLQMINVHAGGTLHQHVPSHTYDDATEQLHEVAIEPGSILAGIYGARRNVNSLHHQAAADIGAGLRVVASTGDGSVEAIEHTTLPVLAVQWHPEMLPTRAQDPIFAWLVHESASRRNG